MALPLNPQELQAREAMVNPDGTPSRYFLQYLRERGGNLVYLDGEVTLKANKSTQIIAGAGLDGGGTLESDVTLDANTQEILDDITTTRGSVLYRGSLGWSALSPSTLGYVLTTQGVGADPTWAAPSSAGVTSVGLSLPSIFSVSGSPVTSTGTLTATLVTQTANLVFAGPSTGAAAAPTFRALVAADIPTLNQNTTGSAATLTTSRSISMTGDVTWTVSFNGSANVTAAGTIANGAVTNAKMADMATATFKGRTTAGTGAPEDLTATQATAMLNTFTSSLKGLVPASGGDSTKYLSADGTFTVPSGGGGGGGGSTTPAWSHGIGDRRHYVTATAVGCAGNAEVTLLPNQASTFYFLAGAGSVSITHDYGPGVTPTVTGFALISSGNYSHGTWNFDGSNDGSTWTTLSSGFTLATSTASGTLYKYQTTFSNSTGYRYYRLIKTSGTASSAPWIYNLFLKITPV